MANITLALTGVSSENVVYGDISYSSEWWQLDTVGSVTPSISYTLNGNAGTGQVGSITTAVSVSSALTGNSATGNPGSVTASQLLSRALSGNASTGQTGSVGYFTSFSYSLTGNQATGNPGSVGYSTSFSYSLTGNQATGNPGSVTASQALSRLLSGNQATGNPGSVGYSTSFTYSLTGNAGVGQIGSVGYSTSFTYALTGNQASGQTGSVVYARNIAISGVSSTGQVGSFGVAISYQLSGNQATGQAGSFVSADPIGAITSLTILDGGTGYSADAAITISPPVNPLGTPAKASLVIVNGVITNIVITDQGSLYTHTPSISISGRFITPLRIGTAQLRSGGVLSNIITDSGSMYSSVPNLQFSRPQIGGHVARGIAVMTGDILTGIQMTDPGEGYLTPPEVSIIGNCIRPAKITTVIASGVTKPVTTNPYFTPANIEFSSFYENESSAVVYSIHAISGTIQAVEITPKTSYASSIIAGADAQVTFRVPNTYYPWIIKYVNKDTGVGGSISTSFDVPPNSTVYSYKKEFSELEFNIKVTGTSGVTNYMVQVRPDYSTGLAQFLELNLDES